MLRSDELDTAQNVVPAPEDARVGAADPRARRLRRSRSGSRATGGAPCAASASSLLVVGLVGLVAARLTRNYVVDSLVARRDDREAASNAWNILTELMRGSFRLMLVVGLLFLLAAWLAGPGRRALTARGWLAPALQNRVWAYVVLALVGRSCSSPPR